eukprot:scaffold29029_cov166-Skeletonema_menzelii.AAC.4
MARSTLKHSTCLAAALFQLCIIQQFASSSAFIIQQINQDNKHDLEQFSTFCIDMFHNNQAGSDSIVSRKWKDMKLAMLQKAQMLDLSVPFNGNRSVFVAKACINSDKDNLTEIIGCCEVIEERIVISREQNKTPRVRPIIENLAVKEEYRRQGVGKALLEAVQQNVQTWIPYHDDIYAQVEEDNLKAKEFFVGNNFEVVFADNDCKKDDLEGLTFRQTTITKFMLRKALDS